jgi:hypothetical protein
MIKSRAPGMMGLGTCNLSSWTLLASKAKARAAGTSSYEHPHEIGRSWNEKADGNASGFPSNSA